MFSFPVFWCQFIELFCSWPLKYVNLHILFYIIKILVKDKRAFKSYVKYKKIVKYKKM